jgi:hypothetical protein
MGRAYLLILLLALPSQPPAPKDDSASRQLARSKREQLLEIYVKEAAGYTIYHDASRKERVELQREPVYVWTNPVRQGGQDGAVFVWTCRGRPEVLSSFFSFVEAGQRKLCHEFHSLSLSVLDVNRSGSNTWIPEAPGIELTPVVGAPAPAGSAARRLAEMRTRSHDFSASTKDHEDRTWELRLLPQPLYRSQSTDPAVLDGALFAFVTSAGTDPEALLVVEARKRAAGGDPVWHYGVARFTDLNLWVRYKGQEVFTAPLIPYNQTQQDPKHRYRVFADRYIPLVEGESSVGKK